MLLDFLQGRWFIIWRRHLRVWFRLAAPAMISNFGEPLLYLLGLGYGLGQLVGEVAGMSYFAFLTIGILCNSAMQTATFEALYSAYTRMDVQQTWRGMLSTPLNINDIVIGEAIWAGTKSLISTSAIMLVAVTLQVFPLWQVTLLLPLTLLLGITFGAMALIITSFAHSYDFFTYYMTLFITPLSLLSGVFFPLDNMPFIIQLLAYSFPLAHAIDITHAIITLNFNSLILIQITIIICYALLSIKLASVLLQRRLLR